MNFPAEMALSHIDLTEYPYTACIHFIPCSVDGRCTHCSLFLVRVEPFWMGFLVAIVLSFGSMGCSIVHVRLVLR